MLPPDAGNARNGADKERTASMSEPVPPGDEGQMVHRTLQIAIRVGTLLILVVWCFQIVGPFLVPIIWGIIIAVATLPGFQSLARLTGGSRSLTATLYVIIALAALVLPSMLLADTLIAGVRVLATGLADGTLKFPEVPAGIAAWPVVGDDIAEFWHLAQTNLKEALTMVGPELGAVARWLVGIVGASALGLLQFILAIFIAAGLLTNAASGQRVAGDLARRLAGANGAAYAALAVQTIRSVARGIVGVALIQSIMAGLGFLAVGQPAAGLLALICLVLAVLQVGPFLVVVPVAIYQFTLLDTPVAILFGAWCFLVLIIDNILKPILLGRGVNLPMLVVFIGAIGGLLSYGILGLFVGPVVLALGYTLVTTWLRERPGAPPRIILKG